MNDALRAKLNLILTAAVAFALGLVAAAGLNLTSPSVALDRQPNPPLNLAAVEPAEVMTQGEPLPAGGFAEIADQITPAVVTIFVEREIEAHQQPRTIVPFEDSPFEDFFRRPPGLVRGSGSGFIISEDGYIVTNNHVVEGADAISVRLADRREFDGVRVVGRDATTDVALLKLEVTGLPAAPLGSSDATRVGEWVIAVGSPGFRTGTGEPLFTTVTAGIVSAKGRNIRILNAETDEGGNLAIEDFIQTDAAINPGNSGGPLVNIRGEVIGVNAAIASTTGSYQGYGFAVPIDLVREVVDDLVDHGAVRRALLGVSIQGVDDAIARYAGIDDVAGAQVMELSPDMPAEEAGIELGDIIVAIDGDEVASVNDLQRKIRAKDPGQNVSVDLVRWSDGRRETVSVTLADAASLAPREEPQIVEARSDDPLGIEVGDIDRGVRRAMALPRSLQGVVVTDFDPYGPFGRRLMGFSQQRVPNPPIITSVNRRKIGSVEEYLEIMEGVGPGDVVGLMVFMTDGENTREVPLTIPLPSGQ
jgi:serine protease Do